MTAPATENPVTDRHGRSKRKLRLSLTDRCNFRCPYCMPEQPAWLPRSALLTRAELLQLVRLFVTRLGIRQLRLTGGEPLLRADLEDCIAELGALRREGLQRISLTTNGSLLAGRAAGLARAGLDDLNVSLDALGADAFAALSGGRGSPGQVIAGIEAARAAGLPVKLNTVVMRGSNEDEILPLLEWARARALPLRFIEYMPLDGCGGWSQERVVTAAEILERLRTRHRVLAQPRTREPAGYWQLEDGYRFGVISTISNPFCASCDRLRLTADGALYACLFAASGRDLRSPLRAGAGDDALEGIIRGHVWHKQAGYTPGGYVERPITMHALGG